MLAFRRGPYMGFSACHGVPSLNTLFTIIEGTYLHLIEDLTGEYARYTFAIIALWKHASLGSQGRRLQAMNDMEELWLHKVEIKVLVKTSLWRKIQSKFLLMPIAWKPFSVGVSH